MLIRYEKMRCNVTLFGGDVVTGMFGGECCDVVTGMWMSIKDGM